MTDPDKLEGRELGAAVAVEVMGMAYRPDPAWEYSREIGRAELVLDQMRATSWRRILRDEEEGQTAQFHRGDGGYIYESTANFMSTAICRAALKAMRAGKE